VPIPDDVLRSLKLYQFCRYSFTRQALDEARADRLAERAMFDDNTTIKIVLALGAVGFWALFLFGFDPRRRRPDLSPSRADKWSTEKFGVWWMARALVILVIAVAGVGFAFGGKGSSSGVWVLFWFSAAGTFVEFFRSKM
jgi:hypothetical protein